MADIVPPWTPILDGIDPPGSWVGAYPYIGSADGDTSYGEFSASGGQYVEAELPAFTSAGITGSRLELQVWNDADAIPVPSLYDWFIMGGHGVGKYDIGAGIFAEDIAAPSGVWSTLTIDNPIPLVSLAAMLAALSTDGLTILSGMVANSFIPFTFRCSFIRFTLIGGEPNLTGQLLDDRVRFWGN